jgi:hypothetical protein
MARKKIREYDSKRLLKEHLKRLAGIEIDIKSAQVCLVRFKSILSFFSAMDLVRVMNFAM